MKSFKRWTVQYEDDNDSSIVYRKSFTEYEEAVILAKITGVNYVIDNLELVNIDLWNFDGLYSMKRTPLHTVNPFVITETLLL
jgi:hypothetical protein